MMRGLALAAAALVLLANAARSDESIRQYDIQVIQGASEAEVRRLTSGDGGVTQSTRSTRTGPRVDVLRVVEGQSASVARGRVVQAVDAVFVSRFGMGVGVERSERVVAHGFTVTAKSRGENVLVEIEAASAREGKDRVENREQETLKTQVLVPEGRWVRVGGGASRAKEGSKVYGGHARAEEGSVLIRVDRVAP